MRHEDDPLSGGATDCDLPHLPLLSARVIWIGEGQRQGVEEDGRRLVKGESSVAKEGMTRT